MSLKQSYKTPVQKDLMRIILSRTYELLKLYIILCIFKANNKTNNKVEAVHNFFFISVEHHRQQSRIGADYEVENTLVWDEMVTKRGPAKSSYIACSSSRNQSIEHLVCNLIYFDVLLPCSILSFMVSSRAVS